MKLNMFSDRDILIYELGINAEAGNLDHNKKLTLKRLAKKYNVEYSDISKLYTSINKKWGKKIV